MPLSVRSARRAVRALPALALLAGGCRVGAGIDERDVWGRFALEQSASVPAAYTDSLFFMQVTAQAPASVNVGIHKTTFLERRAAAPAGSEPDSLVTHASPFDYDVRGDEVRITFRCPPEADCMAGPHLRGPLDGDRLTLHPAPQMSTPSRHYRRVAP